MITSFSRRLWNAFPNCLQKDSSDCCHKLEEFYLQTKKWSKGGASKCKELTISHAIVYLDDVDSWASDSRQETSFNAAVKYLFSHDRSSRKTLHSTNSDPNFLLHFVSKNGIQCFGISMKRRAVKCQNLIKELWGWCLASHEHLVLKLQKEDICESIARFNFKEF